MESPLGSLDLSGGWAKSGQACEGTLHKDVSEVASLTPDEGAAETAAPFTPHTRSCHASLIGHADDCLMMADHPCTLDFLQKLGRIAFTHEMKKV